MNHLKASDVAFTLVVISFLNLIWTVIQGVFLGGWSIIVSLIEAVYQERNTLWELLVSFLDFMKTSLEILFEGLWSKVKRS